MIKSMTGYGHSERISDGRKIFVEIKSLNHRYCDIAVKVPRNYGFLEEKIRNDAAEYISRGKADIIISVEGFDGSDKTVNLNKPLAREYINALCELRDEFSLKDDISVSLVSKFGDIFQTETEQEDPEKVYSQIAPVFTQAGEEFVNSRKREGKKMYADIEERIKYMRQMTEKIEQRSPKIVEEYRKRLENKIKELLEDCEPDETRILTEAAVFADKTDICEETVRLRSHFEEFLRSMTSDKPVGRRLDFLMQEINREINTIGSKVCDIDISRIVIDMKTEAEKVREQIQNIE